VPAELPNLDRVRLHGIDASTAEQDATASGRLRRREEHAHRGRRRHGPNPTAAGAMPQRAPQGMAGMAGDDGDGDGDGDGEDDGEEDH